MKTRFKNLYTTIIGFVAMALGVYFMFDNGDNWQRYSFAFGIGLILVFSKDTLIKIVSKKLNS